MSLAALLILSSPAAVAQALVFWAEGEHWTEQSGSVGPDSPPFASGGACLGSNFGGAAGHYVAYRFTLGADLPDAALTVRHARRADEAAIFSVSLDRAAIGEIRFLPTGGWGHTAAREWAFASVPLGRLAAGVHILRLTSLRDRNNTNVDGFVLAEKGLTPPNAPEELAKLPALRVDWRDHTMRVDPALTLATFAPQPEDVYYPQEEAAQRAALALPRSGRPTDRGVAVVSADGSTHDLRLGESAGAWRLLGLTRTPKAAVLERRFARWGMLAYVGESGLLLSIRLPVGDLTRLEPDSRSYPPGYVEAILASRADLLGDKVLSHGEPTYEAAAGLLPELVAYTPVSSASAPHKLVVDEAGRIGVISEGYGRQRVGRPLFDPADHVPPLLPGAARRGLLDSCLPAVHYAFWDAEAKDGWEEIAFALPGAPERAFLAFIRGGVWRAFSLDPLRELPDPMPFFEALAEFHALWDRELQPAMQLDLPEPRLRDASLAALARSSTTFVDDCPKYGLGGYAADVHHGFPPTTLWMANACLEWGLLDRARRHLTHYLEHYVNEDGSFRYYGPAVSEYGQMLDLVARYVRYTGDTTWLEAHARPVAAIASHLLALRRESLQQPAGAVTRGLLYGSPEADTHKETEFYLSGSAWAWRGLQELARLLRDHPLAGTSLPAPDDLQRECDALRADTLRAARASLVARDPPFLPPYPGIAEPFTSMTAGNLQSYTNYRYWPELLSSEVLDRDLAAAVIEYRRRTGGELMATTRFAQGLDDWPFAQQARAVLAADRVDQYLLGCYGHLAVHQMPGTFCSYEGVLIAGADHRSYMADYCVPVQLTMPLLVRWMLVYEERDREALWLCKAVPRRWFAPGRHFAVRHAPTRWGPVSFRAESDEKAVSVEIVCPPRPVRTLLVRVRRPGGALPTAVAAEGAPVSFDRTPEAATLSRCRGTVRLRLAYD